MQSEREAFPRHYSIADYHNAYTSGKLTPTSVAQTLLDLVSPPSKYSTVFVDTRKEQLFAAAEASTKRFREGKPLGILDGVPVAVKDEVDLSGCKKTLGSANDFTRSDGLTSWCVQKWEDAGAMILGKLNMHEFGLGNKCYSTPLNKYQRPRFDIFSCDDRHIEQQPHPWPASEPPFNAPLPRRLVRRLCLRCITRSCSSCTRR